MFRLAASQIDRQIDGRTDRQYYHANSRSWDLLRAVRAAKTNATIFLLRFEDHI